MYDIDPTAAQNSTMLRRANAVNFAPSANTNARPSARVALPVRNQPPIATRSAIPINIDGTAPIALIGNHLTTKPNNDQSPARAKQCSQRTRERRKIKAEALSSAATPARLASTINKLTISSMAKEGIAEHTARPFYAGLALLAI
jgi:hypothetical protein